MKQSPCPSCAAPVVFRSAASILAVCDYCKSTLIRHDMDLENIGKMGELLEDASPLQLAAEGRYRDGHFAVIGRIQLQYEQGVWNEWHLLFDTGSSGWLSETSGNYVLTFSSPAPDDIPAFDALEIGQNLSLHGESFQLTGKETARAIAGEGELPFKVGSGYEAPVADLSNDTHFATLDYSESPPLLYLGEQVELASLRMTGLRTREEGAKTTRTKAFNCPNCAAPQTIHAEGTKALACGSCGSVIGLDNENVKILEKYKGAFKPWPQAIPLGGRGRLRGSEYEVVGFLRRKCSVDGENWEWSEYLLYEESGSLSWLSEYDGHWNIIKPLTRLPTVTSSLGKPVAVFLGTRYKHFQTATASVSYLIGEFYWRVNLGEQAQVSDYVAPPLMLSSEKTGKEITWSLGEYVTPDEIASAFKLKTPLPKPVGVYANQPSPHLDGHKRYWLAFRLFAVTALAIQIGLAIIAQNKQVYQQQIDLSSLANDPFTSDIFTLDGHDSNVVIRNQTSLNNNWAYLDMNLIEKDTGKAYHFTRDVGYYHGVDGGESWSEGDNNDTATLSDIPAGNYYLQIEGETGSGINTPVTQLAIKRDEPGYSNLFLLLLGIGIFPLIAWWRSHSFESQRWSESDYAAGSDSSDSSDSSDDDSGGDD